MTRRLFRIVIVIAIVLGIFLFFAKATFSNSTLIIISSLIFLLFSFGIQGLIAHSIRPPESKGELITFPLLMWVFWALMFLVFVFFIIPVYCPNFLMDM